MIQGLADPLTEQQNEMYIGLRRLGKTVEHPRYPKAMHAEWDWPASRQIDYMQRVLAWFDKYIGSGTESPVN